MLSDIPFLRCRSENIRHSYTEVYHDTHTQSNTGTMVALYFTVLFRIRTYELQ